MEDEKKLDIFDSCLSPQLRHLTQYIYEGGETIAFEHIFSLLEKRNGQRISQQGRLEWENVTLFQPSHGKISLNDMRTFRIDFLKAQRGVPDVGEGEAKRHLMAKLPTFMASTIFKKEIEKTRMSKKLQINPGQEMTPKDMHTTIRAWSRVAPSYLEDLGEGDFEVLMPDQESAERLLGLHYTEIEGSEHPLVVKKIPVQFTVVDIFDLLEEQLAEAEDLEAHFPRGGARARVVTSEEVNEGYFAPDLPLPVRNGPPYTPSPPGGVAGPPRGACPDNGRLGVQVGHLPCNVSGVVNLGMGLENAPTHPLFGPRVSILETKARARVRARVRVM